MRERARGESARDREIFLRYLQRDAVEHYYLKGGKKKENANKYLRSSALTSSLPLWSLLFINGNFLENEKFFFLFSFAAAACNDKKHQ